MLFIRPTTASLHRAPPAFPTFRQRFLVFRTNIFRWLSHSSFRHLRLFHVFAVNSVAEWPNDDRRQTIVTAGFAEERRKRMRRRNESTQTRFHALIRHPSGTPFSLRSRRFKLSYLGRFFNDSSFFEPPISLLSPLSSPLTPRQAHSPILSILRARPISGRGEISNFRKEPQNKYSAQRREDSPPIDSPLRSLDNRARISGTIKSGNLPCEPR